MLYISLLKKNGREIRRNVWSVGWRQKPFINRQCSVPSWYKNVSKRSENRNEKETRNIHIRLIRSFLICTFALYSTKTKLCNHCTVLPCIATWKSKQPCNKRYLNRVAYIATMNKDPYPRYRPSIRDGLPRTNFPNKIFSPKFL